MNRQEKQDLGLFLVFTEKLSRKVLKQEGLFDLIAVTNTLAQVIDLNDFVLGVKKILKPEGILVVEVGYLPEMIQKNV